MKRIVLIFIMACAVQAVCVRAQVSPISQLSFANPSNPDPINVGPAYQAGLSGNNVLLGVFDSGIDPNQPAFSNNKILASFGYTCRGGVCTQSAINDFNALGPGNVGGHGTGVASIIAGATISGTVQNSYDRSILFNNTSMTGVANKARLIVGQQVFEVISETTPPLTTAGTTDAQTAASLNFIVNQNGLNGQRVIAINNSWGVPPTAGKNINQSANESIDADNAQTRQAIVNAQRAGIVQVWAAGNDRHPFPSTPAAMPAADNYGGLAVNPQTVNDQRPEATMPLAWIVVAASTNRGFKPDGSIEMADSYTNRCGGARYYCLVAPGGIAQPETPSTFDTGAKLAQAYPNQYGNSMISISEGTSQAAPVVTGAIGLLAQQFPWMSGDNLSTTLLTTATSADNPSEIYGRGMLDVGKAIKGPGIFEADFEANVSQPYVSRFANNISGDYGLIKAGRGTLILSGQNTYRGDTTVNDGLLTLSQAAQIMGPVQVDMAGTLKSGGYIAGPVTINGRFIPGNSPGFSHVGSNLTMGPSSIYQQDIAGVTPAGVDTPIGSAGHYSFLRVDSQIILLSGASLVPTLRDVFEPGEPGYGSAAYTPKLGDKFRIATAQQGLSGRFSHVTQPLTDMSAGTKFVVFYNMNNSNSLDLGIVPSSYPTTIAHAFGNQNAKSVGSVLDNISEANVTGISTTKQDELLYAISGQTSAAGISSYAQALAGEVYPAAVATIAQTMQRSQDAVLSRLGDTTGLRLTESLASMSSNTPPIASNTGKFWGEMAYQRVNRGSDSYSGGWNSNLYQLVFGSDWVNANGLRVGGGFTLSNTTLRPVYGSGSIQQGSLFAYGKMPIKDVFLDVMASVGLSASDLSRGNVTGGDGFRNKNIVGNNALVSLGLSRPLDLDSNVRLTPFARLSWQVVTQSGVNEGDAFAALKVNRYTGNGVRGMIGAAIGSKVNDPIADEFTYRAYVSVGAESSGLLNPTLGATLAGFETSMTTPKTGAVFVEAGLYGTAKFADKAYAYAGLSGQARNGQTIAAVTAGLRIHF